MYSTDIVPATESESIVAWYHALRSTPALTRIIPTPPDADDFTGWIRLAREFTTIRETLAADSVTISSASKVCISDSERWKAMEELEAAYRDRLGDRKDLIDLRFEYLKECRCNKNIWLLATSDLNRISRTMLAQCSNVTAFIHAPESEEAAFDDLGCLLDEAWESRALDCGANWRVADRPIDQAHEALATIDGEFSADEITIGLGDETIGSTVERIFETAGIPARFASALPYARCAPALLLSALADYSITRSVRDIATLARFPALERWLARPNLLALLDQQITDTAGNPTPSGEIKSIAARLDSLFEKEKRSLAEQSEMIARILAELFTDDDANEGLGAIEALLEEQTQLKDRLRVTFSEAVRFTLARLDGNLAPMVDGAAVEILGWLEVHMDTAPQLILLNVNERFIPKSINTDPVLPDSVRTRLGLTDNRRRYARDLYLMTAIQKSRARTILISGRRDASDRPLMPSRLVLACPDDELRRRIRYFYERPQHQPISFAKCGEKTTLGVPRPGPAVLPSLRVTAFRDYLACPYRFYLKHVLHLEGQNDSARELSASQLGTLIHGVLAAFGRSDLRHSTDSREIRSFLDSALTREFKALVDSPQITIVVQTEFIRRRLARFATWQAEHARDGWRIEEIEVEKRLTIELDGSPFEIHGHIDRIDRRDGEALIIDYKTSTDPKPPDRMHRAYKTKTWVDLQLPLYRKLVNEPARLGYVLLPKGEKGAGLHEAEWSEAELEEAFELALDVIRRIRAQIFWPPADPTRIRSEEFSAICLDNCLERLELIG